MPIEKTFQSSRKLHETSINPMLKQLYQPEKLWFYLSNQYLKMKLFEYLYLKLLKLVRNKPGEPKTVRNNVLT